MKKSLITFLLAAFVGIGSVYAGNYGENQGNGGSSTNDSERCSGTAGNCN